LPERCRSKAWTELKYLPQPPHLHLLPLSFMDCYLEWMLSSSVKVSHQDTLVTRNQ
jgi:hypothetical protein